MAISLAGLDLSFMRDNPLPKEAPKPRTDFRKPAQNIAVPYFVGDIKPFVSVATREPVEITSRSQLRRYERANGIRQCGDYKPGEIIADQSKRVREATYVSEADKRATDFRWTD